MGLQDMLCMEPFVRAITRPTRVPTTEGFTATQRAPGTRDGHVTKLASISACRWIVQMQMPTYTSTSLSISNAGNWTVRSSREYRHGEGGGKRSASGESCASTRLTDASMLLCQRGNVPALLDPLPQAG